VDVIAVGAALPLSCPLCHHTNAHENSQANSHPIEYHFLVVKPVIAAWIVFTIADNIFLLPSLPGAATTLPLSPRQRRRVI